MVVLAIVTALLISFEIIEPWHLLLLSFLNGVLLSFDIPSRQAIIPNLVNKEHLMNAIVAQSFVHGAATVLGPLLFAPLMNFLDIEGVFYFIGSMYLLAVVLIGGKGAKKSLWDDQIIPQILTDHYRAGSVIGAMGSALVVLVRAALVTGEIPLPNDKDAQEELESLGAVCVDTPVISLGSMVFGQGADFVDGFSQTILDLIEVGEIPKKI